MVNTINRIVLIEDNADSVEAEAGIRKRVCLDETLGSLLNLFNFGGRDHVFRVAKVGTDFELDFNEDESI